MGLGGRRQRAVRVRFLAPLALGVLSTLASGSGAIWAATGSDGPASTAGAGPASWSAEVGIGAVQSVVYADSSFSVLLSLRNIGTRAWPATGPDALRVAYHWFRSDGSIAEWDGQRTQMASPIPPGGSISVSAVVAVPAEPGRYRLQFDLLSRESGWFSEQGWAAPTTSITVGRSASRYFAASFDPVQLPAVLSAGSVNVVTVRVTNTGTLRWPSSGPGAVSLSYHWLRLDDSYAVWDGRRTTLTHPVHASASIVQPLVVQAPSAAGRYTLRVDLVSLQVGWFSRLGSVATLSSGIEVDRAGSIRTQPGSRSHWQLALAALLTALVVTALVLVKRRRRGDRATADDVTAAAQAVEDPPTAITRSSDAPLGHDSGPSSPVVKRAAEKEAHAPHTATPPRTSGVVTAGPASSNGSSGDDEADAAPAAAPATASAARRPTTAVRPKTLADYMRGRGALGDR
jgi:hypothetical protein